MPYAIAMAGKGGTGKTTVAGFLIKYLVQKGKTPILAVDADSNSNLNEVLGVPLEATLGTAREEMKDGVVKQGMTKQMFIEMKLAEAVFEGEGFDLIAMGRPEGAGCYCAANNLLSMYLGNLIDNYPYMVMDNEAGMEHISRFVQPFLHKEILVFIPESVSGQNHAKSGSDPYGRCSPHHHIPYSLSNISYRSIRKPGLLMR